MRSVSDRLGADPFDDEGSRIVVGSVAHVRGRYVVTLQLVDGTESFPPRQLSSSIDDCSTVTQAAALSVALDIEASDRARDVARLTDDASSPNTVADGGADGTEASLDAPVDDAVARPTIDAASSADGGSPSAVSPPVARLERSHVHRGASTSAGAMVAFGLLPRAAGGIDVTGVVRFDGRWAMTLGMSYFPEVHADDPNFSISSGFVHGGACYGVWAWEHSLFEGCAQAMVGSTTLIVDTLQPIKPGARYFVAPALGVRFSQTLGRQVPLVFTVGGDVFTPFPRYQFDVLGTNRTIFTAPVAAGVVFVQVGVGFR